MEKVTRYQSLDGELHETPETALTADAAHERREQAMVLARRLAKQGIGDEIDDIADALLEEETEVLQLADAMRCYTSRVQVCT